MLSLAPTQKATGGQSVEPVEVVCFAEPLADSVLLVAEDEEVEEVEDEEEEDFSAPAEEDRLSVR